MKKLSFLVFALFVSQIIILGQNIHKSFPLDIGNVWYYQAGSTDSNFYYGVRKEITDTLSNGFREITCKYYYSSYINTKKEYWAEINGKFYFNTSPDTSTAAIYYINSITRDTNLSYPSGDLHLISYNIFDKTDTAQESDYILYGGPLLQSYHSRIVFPGIGIVETKDSYFNAGKYGNDSTYLIGMYKNVGVLGDTVIKNIMGIDKDVALPSNFNLEQNYPNPFNPTTNIEYSISKASFVTLKIYDLLGREIATLVNEEKRAGSYKAKFNGSNLPSGIYFYKLQAGDYSSVKKMVLIK